MNPSQALLPQGAFSSLSWPRADNFLTNTSKKPNNQVAVWGKGQECSFHLIEMIDNKKSNQSKECKYISLVTKQIRRKNQTMLCEEAIMRIDSNPPQPWTQTHTEDLIVYQSFEFEVELGVVMLCTPSPLLVIIWSNVFDHKNTAARKFHKQSSHNLSFLCCSLFLYIIDIY